MKKNSSIITASLALIAVIALIIILQWRASVDTPSISVPSPSANAVGDDSNDINTALGVDTNSVQSLIASIERPDSYSRKYRVRIFWDGGESEAEISVFCKGEQYSIIHSQNGQEKTTLFSDGRVYWWYEGSTAVASSAIGDLDENALDLYARLIIFEELLDIPKEDILDASDVAYLDESCIYVEYRHSEKYVYRLHISMEKGLLVGAEVLEDGKTVYVLEAEGSDISALTDEMFALPG